MISPQLLLADWVDNASSSPYSSHPSLQRTHSSDSTAQDVKKQSPLIRFVFCLTNLVLVLIRHLLSMPSLPGNSLPRITLPS